MKTIKDKNGELSRVKDQEADLKVKSGNWTYAPKSDWKSSTRRKIDNSEKSKDGEGKRSKKTTK